MYKSLFCRLIACVLALIALINCAGCLSIAPAGAVQEKAAAAESAAESTAAVELPLPAPAVEAPSPAPSPSPAPTPTPTPTPSPAPTPTPDPWAEFFLDEPEHEYYERNEEKTHWVYKSNNLGIVADKVRDDEGNQTYYIAHIYLRNGERERTGFSDMKYGAKREFPYKIARRYSAVFAQNGDFVVTEDKELKGMVIRDGKIYNEKGKIDSVAFMPDGTLEIISPGEVTAQELLDAGVENVYSFGPTLVEDGIVNPKAKKSRVNYKNPRSGIGMVEPGHYVSIVVEGRKKDARGMYMNKFAELFASEGCLVAYNMDGGASSSMVIMGESLIVHETDQAGQRPVPDVLMFGTSQIVPGIKDKVENDGNQNKKMWPLPTPQ